MEKHDLSILERIQLADTVKAKGNSFFKSNSHSEAISEYQKGLAILEPIFEMKDIANKPDQLWISLNLNMAVCLNNLSKWSEAKKCTDQVIQKYNKNAKAHFLRGVAYKNLNNINEALADLKIAQVENPSDERIKYEINEVQKLMKITDTNSAKIMKKVFGTKESLYNDKNMVIVSPPKYNPMNPHVFMDIQYFTESKITKRIVIELFIKSAPKTVENFLSLCTSYKPIIDSATQYSFKGSRFHKLVHKFCLDGGDIDKGNGQGGVSIFGKKFKEEKDAFIEHSEKGLLSCANFTRDGNDSKFFILFKPASWCNKKRTVFGRIIKGIEIIDELEKVEVDEKDKPRKEILIVDCEKFEEKI